MLVKLESFPQVERNVKENEEEGYDDANFQIASLAGKGGVVGGGVELRSDEEGEEGIGRHLATLYALGRPSKRGIAHLV